MTSSARAAVEEYGNGEIIFIETKATNGKAGRTGVKELPRSQRPDAIFAANDLVALGVLQALTLRGVRVPDDIAIVGCDNIGFASSAAIPLTSVRQPAHQIGSTAATMLLEVIANPPGSAVRHVTLEPELVVRRSTVA